jgi:hypothetical protein
VFYLFAAAPAPRHLDATEDDQEDRPCDAHKTHRQDTYRSKKEIQADKDEDDWHCFVMRALAHHAFSRHFLFFHNDVKNSLIFLADLWRRVLMPFYYSIVHDIIAAALSKANHRERTGFDKDNPWVCEPLATP